MILEKSIREMHSSYEKARIDKIALYLLLRRAVNEYPNLAQFALYRSASSYRELKPVVEDIFEGTKQFRNVIKASPGLSEHTCQTTEATSTWNSI